MQSVRCPIPARFQENMTATTRQVMELTDRRCGGRVRYVCSFPRRYDSAGLVRSRTSRQCRVVRPAAQLPAERRFFVYVWCPAGALHCVTSHVLTTPG